MNCNQEETYRALVPILALTRLRFNDLFQTPLPHQTGTPLVPGAEKMPLKCALNQGKAWEQQRLGMTLILLSPLTEHTCQLLGYLPLGMNHKPNPVRRGDNDLVYSI